MLTGLWPTCIWHTFLVTSGGQSEGGRNSFVKSFWRVWKFNQGNSIIISELNRKIWNNISLTGFLRNRTFCLTYYEVGIKQVKEVQDHTLFKIFASGFCIQAHGNHVQNVPETVLFKVVWGVSFIKTRHPLSVCLCFQNANPYQRSIVSVYTYLLQVSFARCLTVTLCTCHLPRTHPVSCLLNKIKNHFCCPTGWPIIYLWITSYSQMATDKKHTSRWNTQDVIIATWGASLCQGHFQKLGY